MVIRAMALDEVFKEIPIVGEGQSNRIHGGTCRICLTPKEWLLSINSGFFDDLCYKEIYQDCIGKPLKDFKNQLPIICQDCEDELLQAYKFRKMCFEAEDVLNELENFPIQIKREILEEYPENLFTNETQDEAAEESRLNILSVVSGKDNYIPELMDIEENAEESLNGKDNHVPELLETDENFEESLHNSTIDRIQQIPLMEETSPEFQDEMCRICCKYKDKLFSFYDRSFENIPYTEIFQHTIGQPLTDHGNLHLWICHLCENLMLQAFKFRKKCLQSDKQLEKIEEENCKNDQIITGIKKEIDDISFEMTSSLEQQDKEEAIGINQNDEHPIISTMDKETIYNPVNSCRICLKPQNNLRSFKDGIFEELPYKEIYQECMRRPLKDYKDYPSLICQLCEGDLLQFFLFRKKCLEADEKLTELEEQNDTNDLLMEMMEENNLPTINSTKTDTNPANVEPENKDVAEESQPRKKTKIDDGNTEDKIRSLSPKKMPPLVFCLPKVLLSKLNHQHPALEKPTSSKESKDESQDVEDKIATKRKTRASGSMQNPEPGKEMLPVDEKKYQKTIKCEKCLKYFRSQEKLEYHIMMIHEENLKYIKCKICGKNIPKCKFRIHMNNHKYYNKQISEGKKRKKKNYSCLQCSKVFASPFGLKYHTINEHTDAKMQKCPICKKQVKEPLLRYHIQVHENNNKKRRLSTTF